MKLSNVWSRCWISSTSVLARWSEAFPTPRREPLLWFILLPLLGWKLYFLFHTGTTYYLDGSYYLDIAKNVRDGHGLCTDISLYHQGMSFFPHPTPVYPVWPMLLGYLGRIFPLDWLAHWLPAFLYLCSLLLAFRFVELVWYVRFFGFKGRDFHSGHVAVLLLGLHAFFFVYTSAPYTEGLTYTLLFLALFRAQRFFHSPGLWRGLEMGGWAALLILVRSQSLLFLIAFVMVLPLSVLRSPWRRKIGIFAAFGLGFVAVLSPYHWFLSLFMDSPPWLMVRFEQFRASEGLSSLSVMVHSSSLWETFLDRMEGFRVAFRWSGEYSYARVYYFFQYGLLVAAPWWLWDGLTLLENRSKKALRRWLSLRGNVFRLFLLLMALGGFFSIHMFHKKLFNEWNFSTRHGITCAFLMLIALIYLARRHWITRSIAIVLIGMSLGRGFYELHEQTKAEAERNRPEPHYTELALWINEVVQLRPGERTVFVKTYPQTLAVETPQASYHWIYKGTTLEDLLVMFDQMGAHYLVMGDLEKEAKFYKDRDEFLKHFVQATPRLRNLSIYVRKRKGEERWFGPPW